LLKSLKQFESHKNHEIITEYTVEGSFYHDINNWLLNLDNDAYDKIAYFVGELMYKLNEYGKPNEKGETFGYKNESNIILHRGINVSYLDALSYQIHKDKIICFQGFTSTSEKKEVSETFKYNPGKYDFFILMKIDHCWKKGFEALCFNIKEISNEPGEDEFLFHPFSFFRITDFSIDYKKREVELKLESINKKDILEEKIKENEYKKIHYNKIEKIMEIKDKSDKESESEKEVED